MATSESSSAPVVVEDRTTRRGADRCAVRQARRCTSSSRSSRVLWLVPTIGLFLTSLLSPDHFQPNGWWKVIAHPHLATWENYSNIWNNTDIPHVARASTAEIASAAPCSRSVAALRRLRLRVDRLPRPRLAVRRVIALLVVPLQMGLIPIFQLYNTVEPLTTRCSA